MEPENQSSVGKTIAGVLLVGLGLAGLGMSLCGGIFTVITLIEALQGKTNREAEAWAPFFLITGSVSLVIGLGVLGLAVVAWQRMFKRR